MLRIVRTEKPEALQFDFELFDAVILEDGRHALITGYGIYDNQYWCEICYPDGVHLGAADYFSSNPAFYSPHIISRINDQRKHIVTELIKALEEMENMYAKMSGKVSPYISELNYSEDKAILEKLIS